MIRSVGLPNFSAATTPPKIASGTTITNASAANFNELTSAAPRIGPAADWYWVEVPKLPCRMWPSQVMYCCVIGLSVPSW